MGPRRSVSAMEGGSTNLGRTDVVSSEETLRHLYNRFHAWIDRGGLPEDLAEDLMAPGPGSWPWHRFLMGRSCVGGGPLQRGGDILRAGPPRLRAGHQSQDAGPPAKALHHVARFQVPPPSFRRGEWDLSLGLVLRRLGSRVPRRLGSCTGASCFDAWAAECISRRAAVGTGARAPEDRDEE